MSKLNIVSLGAGSAQDALLRGLKKLPINLKVIVPVSNDGGHSGKLRNLFNIPQVGDGRQCLMALAEQQSAVKNFETLMTGFSPGNWFLAELLLDGYSLADAFGVLGSLLNAQGEVLPATEANVDIVARFANGEVIAGEWEFMEADRAAEITELFLEPRKQSLNTQATEVNKLIKASPRAIAALDQADYVIIGPGSLRTSLIASLLPYGIRETIWSAKPKIIYICNLITKPGQTDGFTVEDHLKELIHYLKREPDFIVINNADLAKPILKHYRRLKAQAVAPGDLSLFKGKVIAKDLLPPTSKILPAVQKQIGFFKKWVGLLAHDSEKLAQAVAEIIGLS